jgi:phosphoserine phosphatase RsbU/P
MDATTTKGTRAGRILIADDQADVLEALAMLLKQHGYDVTKANSPAAILRTLKPGNFDLLLMDLNYARDTTSGREGLHLVSQIHAVDENLPVVVMTAWGTVELAVEAMHKGVGDFVLKPWDNGRLLEILHSQIEEGVSRRKAARFGADPNILRDEMLEARKIQESFLPTTIPAIAGYEISGAWQPARMVGGDYFDVFKLSPEAFGLCIADVAGKGMPAALLMSNLQASLRGAASESPGPQELCSKINRTICGHLAPEKFITLFYALLDVPRRELTYTNAGHNPPMVVRHDGSRTRLQEGGPALGVIPSASYGQGRVQLEPGDRCVFFTDGVTEALASNEEEFGEARLFGLVEANRTLGAEALQKKILETVSDFCRGDFQDDATLIVVAVE